MAGLLDQFVCVRLVQANHLDLTLFQFDYDLTFAVFFMNADKTIYGRFGSRSDHTEAARDMSLEGFRAALAGALELHKNFPANRAALAGKQPRPPRFPTADDYPSLRGKFQPRLDYEGKVVPSCMHCHQVREAERDFFRRDRRPIPVEELFPHPMPDVLGLALDPRAKAKVASVARGTPAAQAGFQSGDDILSLEGQPLLSTADAQWVLHHASAPATLHATVQRGRGQKNLTLSLPADWRRHGDISWRVTTWDLLRMATGGLKLKALDAAGRAAAKLADGTLALRVEHVGQYGAHAAGKKAGFKKDDIIIALEGDTTPWTESEFVTRLLQTKMPGDKAPVTVLRAGEKLSLELPAQ